MGELIAAASALGLAGLDPVGALIAIGALARGIHQRWVIGYGLVVLFGTIVLGTVLSITVGRRLAEVNWAAFLPQGSVGALVELGAAAALLVWALLRLKRPTTSAKKPRRQPTAAPTLIGAGFLFAASAVLDPTFDAAVVVLGRGVPIWQVIIGHALWVVISQAPLGLLLVTIPLGRHQRAIAWFQQWWDRSKIMVGHVLTIVLVLAAVMLMVDAVWYFLAGAFLLPTP